MTTRAYAAVFAAVLAGPSLAQDGAVPPALDPFLALLPPGVALAVEGEAVTFEDGEGGVLALSPATLVQAGDAAVLALPDRSTLTYSRDGERSAMPIEGPATVRLSGTPADFAIAAEGRLLTTNKGPDGATITLGHEGMALAAEVAWAEGARFDLSLDLSVDRTTLEVDVPDGEGRIDSSLDDLTVAGTFDVPFALLADDPANLDPSGPPAVFDFDLGLSGYTLAVDMEDEAMASASAGEPPRVVMTGSAGPLAYALSGRIPLPLLVDPEAYAANDPATLFDGTLQFALEASQEAAAFEMSIEDPQQRLDMAAEGGRAALELVLNQEGFRYGGSFEDVRYAIASEGLPDLPPFDIDFALGDASIGLGLALPESSRARGTYAVRLGDLALGEATWDAIEPSGAFPRESLTVDIALAGEIAMPEGVGLAALSFGAEPERLDLDLETFLIEYGDAQLTGTGGGSVSAPTDGQADQPSVELDVTLLGENLRTLILALTNVEAVPPEVPLVLNGALNALMRPTGPDSWRAVVEMGPDGIPVLNGLPFADIAGSLPGLP